MKNIHQQNHQVRPKDYWRPDFCCEAAQWGFRCGSQIAELISYLRDEHRAKYEIDYRLRRMGKNKFLVTPGDHGSYGLDLAIEESRRFKTTVYKESLKDV